MRMPVPLFILLGRVVRNDPNKPATCRCDNCHCLAAPQTASGTCVDCATGEHRGMPRGRFAF